MNSELSKPGAGGSPDSPGPSPLEREPGPVPGPDEAANGAGRAPFLERLLCVAAALGFAAVTAVALHLEPDPSGVGTHTQLGLPPCGLYDRFGIPCLSCGFTTAFAAMARLRVVEGFRASPFGAALYLAGFAAAVAGLGAAVSGRSFFDWLARLDWTWIGAGAGALLLASWAYKILTASALFV
jgi:hypothetical protein